MTFAAVAAALESATYRAALMCAAQLIQHVPTITERDKLAAIVRRRLEEFKSK